MGYELIITEKPQAAKKIAEALADGKPIKESVNGVPYYKITHGKKDIVVACAVGHLYTVAEKDKGRWKYPVYDVEWVPSSESNKESAFTKKYLAVIKKLCKDASEFTVATDYDIEGEVIGVNVIRFACKQKDANRMKFSTLTKGDLIESYEHKSKTLDWGQAKAGLTRHELDWLYGINLSRALTLSVKNATGGFKILSSGRVQGPALKILVDKEKEIQNFKPTPYWMVQLLSEKNKQQIEAWHKEDKFWEKEKAQKAYDKAKSAKTAKVEKIENREQKSNPPFPFDLTSLQVEAHKTINIVPKRTLELAQNLYIGGYISYPRTSSQKLPPAIGYAKILEALKKQDKFAAGAAWVLTKSKMKPNEGTKTDEAHPAIYPTGIAPHFKDPKEADLYELIVRRFFAVFGEPAVRESMIVSIDVNSEPFVAKGIRTKVQGWFELYGRFVMLKDEELPALKEGEEIPVKKLSLLDKETQPPKRYTAASIIKELEKRNLGTKATRAAIIDNLYNRGYVNEKSIEATELGIKTSDILGKYSPEIQDEELTRSFEDEMEDIRKKKKTTDEVIDHAKNVLGDTLKKFKEKEKFIGKELGEANITTRNIMTHIGKCPVCKEGDLQIRKGRFGSFIACNKYPDCKTTFSLPTGIIKPTDKICESCGMPMVKIIKKRSAQDICINPKCKSKITADKEALQEMKDIEKGAVEKECPKCKEGKLVVRKSIYGAFLGCSNYPKCRYTERLDGEEHSNLPKFGEKAKVAKTAKPKSSRKKSSSQKKPRVSKPRTSKKAKASETTVKSTDL